MIRKQFLSFLLIFIFSISFGQSQEITISSKSIQLQKAKALKTKFKNFKLVQIYSKDLMYELGHTDQKVFNLNVGTSSLRFQLYPNKILSKKYSIRIQTENKIEEISHNKQIAYLGNFADDAKQTVSLTVNDNFIYGILGKGENAYFIEPLNFLIPNAENDIYIIYQEKDVLDDGIHRCASDEFNKQQGNVIGQQRSAPGNARSIGMCYEVELGLASDFSMFQKYGSVVNVENRNIGVVNNVQTDYVGTFDDDINFNIVQQFVSACNTCDPWSSTTDASALLADFRSWGNNNGFTVTTDNAGLWTDRNITFNGSSETVGLAYTGNLNNPLICTNSKYHLLEDFTSNANLIRGLQSHEMGHNWGYNHDAQPTGFIMSPTLVNTTTWSGPSLTRISNNINVRGNDGCLDLCGSGGGGDPPTADFTSNIRNICEGTEVSFYDLSIGDPIDVVWSFPGGNPGSSTDLNPKVVYNNPGTYNVTLTASNNDGSNDESKNAYITVGDGGRSVLIYEDFEEGTDEWTIINGDNGFTWVDDNILGARYGSNSLMIQNFDYSNSGQSDFLISQEIDLAGYDDITLTFDHAYRRRNNNRKDSLKISLSTDGGQTFPNTLFAATETGNEQFATMPDGSQPFFPQNNNQWCFGNATNANCISLNLNAFRGMGNVVIAFENVNGFGNNMFLDNILLSGTCQSFNQPIAEFESDVQEGCAPLQVNFFDISANDPISWAWQFPGGIPASSSEQDPLVTYPNPGNYDVILTVSNIAGSNTITESIYITVSDLPIPDFDFSETAPFTFQFENFSIDATSYLWDFGDGMTSIDENPIHAYDNSGSYLVTLTASNDCGVDQVQMTLMLETLPMADFSSDVTEGCTPLDVQFINNSSDNADAWFWEFDGGSPATSSLRNPFVDYFNEGTFNVTLTVTNDLGSNTITKENYISVLPLPLADFDFVTNMLTVDFSNLSLDFNQIDWDFGDGNVSDANSPIHTYSEDGTYTVILVASNDCGSNEISMQVIVSSVPSAGFSSDVQSGCAPLEVQFSDQSSANVVAWNWSFPGGNPSTSTEQNPVVNYSNVGSFDVQLEVTTTAGTDLTEEIAYITVIEEPTASFNFDVSGNTITFANTSQNAVDYTWNFGDGNGSSDISPSHTYNQNRDYLVTLTASNNCGTDVFGETIRIGNTPLAVFNADATSGCLPLTVQFTNQSSGGATDFMWLFEGGNPATSMEQNPTVVYETLGVYSVELRATNALGTNVIIEEDFIEIFPRPASAFNFDANNLKVEFDNSSTDADTYVWDFGDGITSTEFNPSHEYSTGNNYFVQLISINDCGRDTIIREVDLSTVSADNRVLRVEKFNLFPNPNNGQFTFELTAAPEERIFVSIINALGESIQKEEEIDFSTGNIIKHIDLKDFTSGVYLLGVRTNSNQRIFKKIVVLKF